ncbi:pilus assembly protein, partial [Rhizobium sp. TRM95111]|uniref:TadE/TadG family type IV pilus assembly protein n=1 Tax=Rhizobium alarense TaxID=2846851 RepID=UPI001F34A1ED
MIRERAEDTRPGRGILVRLRTLLRRRDGVGAVEFAIVVPMLIMVYIGAFEISVAMTVYRKISRASSSISDLITQKSSVDTDYLDGMENVARTIIAPFTVGTLSLKITGIVVSSSGTATVAWSRDQAGATP